MIALRLFGLLLAALGVLGVFGQLAAEVPASALRLWTAATFAVLAPLFWPGVAGSSSATAVRVWVWSAAVAGLAMAVLMVAGRAGSSAVDAGALGVGLFLMLGAVLLLVHAGAAALQALLISRREKGVGAALDGSTSQRAGAAAALVMALWGSLPLWMGPIAERLSRAHDGALDAVLMASPLTHLAVASGNDLLRNPWLYQYANLAALPVNYPSLASLATFYTAACTLLAAWLLIFLVRDRTATPITKEKTA